jgi:hypothetical protein
LPWIQHIRAGRYFEWDGVIAEVARVIEDGSRELVSSINQAAELLRAYIGLKNASV